MTEGQSFWQRFSSDFFRAQSDGIRRCGFDEADGGDACGSIQEHGGRRRQHSLFLCLDGHEPGLRKLAIRDLRQVRLRVPVNGIKGPWSGNRAGRIRWTFCHQPSVRSAHRVRFTAAALLKPSFPPDVYPRLNRCSHRRHCRLRVSTAALCHRVPPPCCATAPADFRGRMRHRLL